MANFKEYRELEEKFTGRVQDIKVEDIHPDKKDLDRVAKLKPTQEEKMANAITDPIKLVRRTKAYILKNGDGVNPFTTVMMKMGFTDKQIGLIAKYSAKAKPPELPAPAKRNGKDYKHEYRRSRNGGPSAPFSIMVASSIYSGKLSKVMPDLWGDEVILLGTSNGKRKVAIIGSASGIKKDENGLDYYSVPKSGVLPYMFDTGMGYREATSEIVLTDYILVKDGKPVTKFKDSSYAYYVFK